MSQSLADLELRFAQGDQRSVPPLISRIEAGTIPDVAKPGNSTDPKRLVVGISGSGGAGKSTLVGALIRHLREQKKSVAVLACDPQSPVTGGALLGDRIRVQFDPADRDVFFRSLSTRGATGGISAACAPTATLLQKFGFDVVLIETVGVGQDQVAVRSVVDCLVLLVTPGSGDEVQWEKAGVIEVADIVVVNKCDMPGADRVRAQLTSALSLVPGAAPAPVLGLTATSGEGVAELWSAIEAHAGSQ